MQPGHHDHNYSYPDNYCDEYIVMLNMLLMTVVIQGLEQMMSKKQRKRRETALESSNRSESSSTLVRSIKTGLDTLAKMGTGTPEQVSCFGSITNSLRAPQNNNSNNKTTHIGNQPNYNISGDWPNVGHNQ